MPQSNYLIPYECKFPPTVVKYIRVMVEPIGKLPPSLLPPPPAPPKTDPKTPPSKTPPKKKEKANPDKDKGWFFIDELFVN